jgi:hypothetical protein
MNFTPRSYQIEIADRAAYKLVEQGIVYLAMQVRTGKTLTALMTAKLREAKRVLFITKKKAISSIEYDHGLMGHPFDLVVTNYESLHKVNDTPFDIIICDEHHRNGAFPKPNISAKLIKQRWGRIPMIFLSGTPTPESFSQFYHQFWVSHYSPFKEFSTFYKWAKEFVDVTKKNFGYGDVADYSRADEQKINRFLEGYIIDYTQEEAGFKTSVKETVIEVQMKPVTYAMAKRLKKDLVIEGETDTILADTAVKLQNKLHQIYSGTCIGESGNVLYLDDSKAAYIKNHYDGKKVGIFYKFKGELELLKKALGSRLTTDLDEFNKANDLHIALQVVSGREGISLRNADCLVYFNIDFSAVSYWQSRDRLTTKERTHNQVYWLFAKDGIERSIYKAVLAKKNYTLTHFKNDLRKEATTGTNQGVRAGGLVRT